MCCGSFRFRGKWFGKVRLTRKRKKKREKKTKQGEESRER